MRQRRNQKGGQIAELAPALLILFIVVLFPMIDLMYIGLGYCCGWYLNHMTSRACSTIAPPSKTTGGAYPASVINNINTGWTNSGFCTFTGATIVSNACTAVPLAGVPDPSSNANNLNTMMVQATTSVQVNPFLVVPSMGPFSVAGLTKPITFNYFDRVPLEENGLN